jgi:hypothetical protein
MATTLAGLHRFAHEDARVALVLAATDDPGLWQRLLGGQRLRMADYVVRPGPGTRRSPPEGAKVAYAPHTDGSLDPRGGRSCAL